MQYQVKDPNGQLHIIDGPEGASPEEVIAQAQKVIPFNQESDPVSNLREQIEPGVMGETSPVEQKLIENFSTAVGWAGTAQLGLGLAKAGVSKAGSVLTKLENWVGGGLERMGAKSVNTTAGLKPATFEHMTNKLNPNPGKLGIEIGGKLADSKAVTSDPIKTFDNAAVELKTAGENVGKAWEKLKPATELSEYVANGELAVKSEAALNPLKSIITELESASLKSIRNQAKPFKEIYTTLSESAKQNGGKLSLTTVQKELKTLGKRMDKGSEEMQSITAEVYGQLANVRESMVSKVAEAINNTALKQEFLNANAEFSRWIRILPDIKKAASKGAVNTAQNHGFFKNMWDMISYPLTRPGVQGKINQLGRKLQSAPSPAPSGFPLSAPNLDVLSGLKRGLLSSNTLGLLNGPQ